MTGDPHDPNDPDFPGCVSAHPSPGQMDDPDGHPDGTKIPQERMTPPELWIDGDQGTHTTVVLEVRVCVSKNGQLWSAHQFRSPQDEHLAMSWSGGGARHIAHGLLTEAVRRETFVCALVELTKNPGYLTKYMAASEPAKSAIESHLAESVATVFAHTSRPMMGPSVKEVLAMLAQQIVGSPR